LSKVERVFFACTSCTCKVQTYMHTYSATTVRRHVVNAGHMVPHSRLGPTRNVAYVSLRVILKIKKSPHTGAGSSKSSKLIASIGPNFKK
jgi:hypothetical protein